MLGILGMLITSSLCGNLEEVTPKSVSSKAKSASSKYQNDATKAQSKLQPPGIGLPMAGVAVSQCIFCQIATKSTSTTLLHADDKVVAFQDIRPAAARHYLVIPVDHIPTVKDLQRTPQDYSLVCHMLEVGKTLLQRDAPQCHQYRFGFHQPPFSSVNHLHLHCLALPYIPRWKYINICLWDHLGFLKLKSCWRR